MNVAEIELSPGLLQQAELAALVHSRDQALREEAPSPSVRAVWDLRRDAGQRQQLVLALHDEGSDGDATKIFTPTELAPVYEEHFRERVRNSVSAMARVGRFRAALRQLHENVRQWLNGIEPPIVVDDTEILLDEEQSGTYEAPALVLRRGDKVMRLTPVATWVVGAEGRVELEYGVETALFIFKNNAWHSSPDNPRRKPSLLTGQSFVESVEALWE